VRKSTSSIRQHLVTLGKTKPGIDFRRHPDL